VADPHHGVHIAAGIEIRLQLHPDRIGSRHQVIEDAVGDLLMGDRLVAEAVHIQLDRLQLHNPGPGLVNQAQHREVGIAREGALAGEFRQLDRHLIRAPEAGVVEADQLGFGDGALAVEGGLGQRTLEACSVQQP